MKKRVIAGAVIIVATVVVAIVVVRLGSDDGGEVGVGGVFTVQRGDLVISLTERGTLKTKNATNIRTETRGSATIEWLIDEGTRVAEGDVLCELDRTDLQKELEQNESQVIQLESELKAATTEQQIQEEQNRTDIEKAELALEVARVVLKKYMEGDIGQEDRKHKLAIKKAKSDLSRAERKCSQLDDLLEKGFITQDQAEQERLARDTADDQLKSAELAKKLYEEHQKPLDTKQKRAAVTEAERNVERARKQAEARLEGKVARVRQKEISLNSARERVARARKFLDKMTLVAPTPGTVIYGNPDRPWDTEDIKVGGRVWSNLTLITLPDPTEMAVVINVHESDIERLEVGMRAVVTSETRQGVSHEGKISKIGAVANAGRRGSDNVKRFRIEVSLETGDVELRSGTLAKVELKLGELKDVLYVPVQAINAGGGKFHCYVRSGRMTEQVEVALGRSNENFVEVLEGLEEGQQVLLYEPEEAQSEENGQAIPAPNGS